MPRLISMLARLAASFVVAVILAGPAALDVGQAHAADASIDVAAGETSRFVRIGLGKSVVVRLPSPSRDVLVGNPGVVDAVMRASHTAYLFAKEVGQTNIFFFDADGRQLLALDIEVAQDGAALQQLIRRVIPNTQIRVETVGDNVILTGSAANPAEARQAFDLAVRFTGDEQKVVSSVAIAAKEQVLLRVRVVEVQRNIIKQLGINMSRVVAIGGDVFNFGIINPFSLGNVAANSFFNGGVGTSVGQTLDGNAAELSDFNATLRLMERDGIVRTLAEPTLTAISGESAKFLAGGEFPVPVATDDNDITVEFKPFGVGLGFTPVVMSEGRISMRVSTEVSELSNEAAITVGNPNTNALLNIPSLTVRRAETTVELPSGGSLVMAGLIQEKMRQDLNGLPGLMHLPVLGALFRSRDFQRNETELVVIVTPYTVNAVNERQLVTPDKGFNPPNDVQTVLLGQLNKVYGVGRAPEGVYHGEVGFIVE